MNSFFPSAFNIDRSIDVHSIMISVKLYNKFYYKDIAEQNNVGCSKSVQEISSD